MHTEILSDKQKELLPYIGQFKRSFYLVGGTAIALHLGHRESIDFDLFTTNKLNKKNLKEKIRNIPFPQKIIFEDTDQLHYYANDVKITFFQYPFAIIHAEKLDSIISFPSLLTLAAMKAFALGRRAKWKDYVDLFFLIKYHFSIQEIADEAINIFDTQFSEKLFRQQLAYHSDINYSESVQYLPGFEVSEDEIKQFLIDVSIKI
jgi:hypothetical protein